jgi:hypothetical protein
MDPKSTQRGVQPDKNMQETPGGVKGKSRRYLSGREFTRASLNSRGACGMLMPST